MVVLRPGSQEGLKETLDRILDKGVVIDLNARACLGDFKLLGINAIIILSSFKTAAKIGLDFPEGTNLNTPAWKDLLAKQPCPLCGKEQRTKELKEEGCPWCGWNYRPKYKEDKKNFVAERKYRYGKGEKWRK
jgi:rubredoxin